MFSGFDARDQHFRVATVVALGMVATMAAGCVGSPVVATPTRPVGEAPGESAQESTSDAGPQDSFSLVATGDVLIHPPLTEQAELDGAESGGGRDFAPLFAGLEPLLSAADVGLCHLEVPLAAPEGPFLGWPLFSAPPEVADGLAAAGYDVCTTASNHTVDQGEEGVVRTLDRLDEVGIDQTGAARTEEEATTPLVRDVDGVQVGHVSHTFGFNTGTSLPPDKPWMSNLLDADEILAGARAAEEAGADVVVASLHWGVEYQHEPSESQIELAEQLAGDPAIDLIIGHHAHVVQPFEKIGDTWVAYGLGNSVARHAEPRGITEEGVAAHFTFERTPEDDWAVAEASFVPTLVDLGPPVRLVDLTTAEPSPAYDAAATRIEEIVLSRGAAEDGLVRHDG
ncbi:Bacterial capsule synthesis protein [Actinoalloteichus sp. GBA129-24]|uniref:Bacterial capsule synthesis protein n=2 Tax=Pseudonocardiaceae TaxID=2070 RepID=A0AAC9LIY1_9PSEU|nr:Bacterial capsule synthesis protein [Actinoalloteichus fjordicus]APU23778.1 Bacterial capsule synthesis protein [Actinoalloteichus sp. GBA129-24]